MSQFKASLFLFFLFSFINIPFSAGAEGKELYLKYCASCHGKEGEGGKAYALNKDGLLVTTDIDYFTGSIKYGRPLSGCPPHEMKLNDEEIKALALFIKSWQKGRTLEAPGHSVEAKDSKRGRELFPICGACHGLKSEGAMGPPLFDVGFLKSASDQVIRRTIMYGRPGTPMKGFTRGYGPFPLSMEDIDEIIAYMRFMQADLENGQAEMKVNPD